MLGDLEPTFEKKGFLAVSDLEGVADPPEHLPPDIHAAFLEGARCKAIGCYNAGASMFRLCLDLTTKPLLPDPAEQGTVQPTKEQRHKLGKRISWLIDQKIIPPALSTLTHAVREDANDGVHDGTLGENDAEDLLDFTIALLERQFTEPERLRLAELRRIKRRTGHDPSEGNPVLPVQSP